MLTRPANWATAGAAPGAYLLRSTGVLAGGERATAEVMVFLIEAQSRLYLPLVLRK